MAWDDHLVVSEPTPYEKMLCRSCNHERQDHKHGRLCTGEMKTSDGVCSCIKFVPLVHQETAGGYSTVPPSRPVQRHGFTSTSSRSEIGSGQVQRPNLQNKKNDQMSPEWTMFGVRLSPTRVRVYASTKLSYLDLRQERGYFEEIHAQEIEEGKITDTPWDIKGRMVDFVKVEAPDYRQAMQFLFTQGWRPDGDEPTTEDMQQAQALRDAYEADLAAQGQKAIGPAYAPVKGSQDDEGDIIDAEVVEDDEGDWS